MPFFMLLFDENSPITLTKCVPFVFTFQGHALCVLILLDFCLCFVPGTQSWQVDSSLWCGLTAILPKQISKKLIAVTDPCHCCVVHHWYLLGLSVDAQYPCRRVGAVVIVAVSCKIIPPVCDETRHDHKIVRSYSVECDGVVCGCWWLVVCDQLSRCPGAGGR